MDTTFLHTKYDSSYYEIFLLEFSKLLVIFASLLLLVKIDLNSYSLLRVVSYRVTRYSYSIIVFLQMSFLHSINVSFFSSDKGL